MFELPVQQQPGEPRVPALSAGRLSRSAEIHSGSNSWIATPNEKIALELATCRSKHLHPQRAGDLVSDRQQPRFPPSGRRLDHDRAPRSIPCSIEAQLELSELVLALDQLTPIRENWGGRSRCDCGHTHVVPHLHDTLIRRSALVARNGCGQDRDDRAGLARDQYPPGATEWRIETPGGHPGARAHKFCQHFARAEISKRASRPRSRPRLRDDSGICLRLT